MILRNARLSRVETESALRSAFEGMLPEIVDRLAVRVPRGKFDRLKYQREYMREWRAKASDTKRRSGRPKNLDVQAWVWAGLSRSPYYRRKKEGKV